MSKRTDTDRHGQWAGPSGPSHGNTELGGTRLPVRSPDAVAQNQALTAGADLCELCAVDVVRALAQGNVTAEEYAKALLRRCAEGAGLNAFISLQPEQVLEAAHECDRRRQAGSQLGPLHGLPIPVKDSVNTSDLPTTAGTPALRHFQPRKDAPLIRFLRDQGAIVLGKNNMHELSWGYTSTNQAYGAVHNPYDPTRISGGSSGGTAACIAHRMAPLGVAEDTEGSIRVPAALCGITGFRPTTGRYPNAGTAPTTDLFDQLGPQARTVADLILFDRVLTGSSIETPWPDLKGTRLGVIRSFFWVDLDPEVERITEAALNTLRKAGVELVEGDLPDVQRLIEAITTPVQYHDFRPTMTRYLTEYKTDVSFDQLIAQASWDIRHMLENWLTPAGKDFVHPQQYREILNIHLPALKALYRAYFESSGVSAIIFPATVLPAPLIAGASGKFDQSIEIRGRRMRLDKALSRNIGPGSTASLPGLVLPVGLTSGGLPVALELDGPPGTDQTLLTLGLELEAAFGRLPPPPTVDADYLARACSSGEIHKIA